MEAAVCSSMECDASKHRTMAEFADLVRRETDRHLKETGIKGSNVVAGVVSTLKKNGVLNPVDVPIEQNEEGMGGRPACCDGSE